MPRPGLRISRQRTSCAEPLLVVLAEHAAALVGPPGDRLAEVVGQHGVRDLVRQHAVEQLLHFAEDLHLLR